MSDADVKPDVSSETSTPVPQHEQPRHEPQAYRRSRRAVLVFEDDPDFGEFLAPRPQARHPGLIQYPHSNAFSSPTPSAFSPPPSSLSAPGTASAPAPAQRPPNNLGTAGQTQPLPAGYQSVEVNQVERPSAARPWPAPPAEYANRPQKPGAQGGQSLNPLVLISVFVLIACAIGAFVFFFDKKMKKDELEHIRTLVATVVREYKSGNKVPEQLKEVADAIEGVFKDYGFEPVEVEKVVQTTRAVVAEL